jgi:hypothetical protein
MAKDRNIVPSSAPIDVGAADTELAPLSIPQRAISRVQFGERFAATAEVQVTPAGLLAIGGMVGAILLGVAVVVQASRR